MWNLITQALSDLIFEEIPTCLNDRLIERWNITQEEVKILNFDDLSLSSSVARFCKQKANFIY